MNLSTTSTAMLNQTKNTTQENYTTPNYSTWQQLVVGAGSTAAVISEESMKCLKYCISWLQYAIRHLTQQMELLTVFIQSAEEKSAATLDAIKKDMISTLRKVIHVITRYAGNALPYQAKDTIRRLILNLPNRWASLNTSTLNNTEPVVDEDPSQNALRLLAFGQESNDMLSSIYSIFDDTIQQAEKWLEKLKVIHSMSSNIPIINNIKLPSHGNNQVNYNTDINYNDEGEFNNDEDDEFYNLLLAPIQNLHLYS